IGCSTGIRSCNITSIIPKSIVAWRIQPKCASSSRLHPCIIMAVVRGSRLFEFNHIRKLRLLLAIYSGNLSWCKRRQCDDVAGNTTTIWSRLRHHTPSRQSESAKKECRGYFHMIQYFSYMRWSGKSGHKISLNLCQNGPEKQTKISSEVRFPV